MKDNTKITIFAIMFSLANIFYACGFYIGRNQGILEANFKCSEQLDRIYIKVREIEEKTND